MQILYIEIPRNSTIIQISLVHRAEDWALACQWSPRDFSTSTFKIWRTKSSRDNKKDLAISEDGSWIVGWRDPWRWHRRLSCATSKNCAPFILSSVYNIWHITNHISRPTMFESPLLLNSKLLICLLYILHHF